MNTRFILCFISLITVCPAADLGLPSAGFDTGKVPPEGWQVFEFGDNGDITKIKRIDIDDGIENNNTGCLVFEVGGAGGGHGIFSDVEVKSLAVGDQVEFSVKAMLQDPNALQEGKLEIHVEFVSDGEPVGRTDELETSVSLQRDNLNVARWKKVTHKHTIASSDINDLAAVDTLRFVIVAIQPDDGFKDSYGSVFVDDAAAKLLPAKE